MGSLVWKNTEQYSWCIEAQGLLPYRLYKEVDGSFSLYIGLISNTFSTQEEAIKKANEYERSLS